MNSYLKNMPRKGVSAVADFGDEIVEDKLKQEEEDFQSELNFYNSDVHSDLAAKAEFDAEKSFGQKTGDFIMNVLSIPDRLDKAVGIYGTRQKAIKALTGGLSEDHLIASLAGEMLVPDTIDLVTLGLGYIPRRVLLKGPKMVKAFLKSKASKLPKYARKLDDTIPAGSKLASENDVAKMIAEAQNAAKLDAMEAEQVLRAQGKVNVTGQDIKTELAQSGKRQFVDPDNLPIDDGINFQDLANLELRKAGISVDSPYALRLKKAANKIPMYVKKTKQGHLYFDYELFKQATKKGEDGRLFLELYQAEMSRTLKDIETAITSQQSGFKNFSMGMMNKFKPVAELLGLTGSKTLGRMDMSNVHHIAALKGLMGIYDKVGFHSPLMLKVNDVFYKKLKGLGGQQGNFARLLGMKSDKGSPHYLTHAFLDDAIGRDGSKFFTKQVLTDMNASDTYRLQKAAELADIIEDAYKVAQKSQDVYDAVADAALAVDYDEVSATLVRLMDKNLLKLPKLNKVNYNTKVRQGLATDKYRTDTFDSLIRDIIDIHKAKPIIPDVDFDALLFDANAMADLRKTFRLFDELNVKYPEIEFSGATLDAIMKRNKVGLRWQFGLFDSVKNQDVLDANIKELFEKQIRREKGAKKAATTKNQRKYKDNFDLKL
tara:strand:- start:207 stop:2177 length:1971 start_codon:yes stop_codon:yes gene_type:complete